MKERDSSVDFARGAAILFVVLGHSIQANLTGNERSIVWDVILHFQMPLMFMISGYVMGWTEPAKSISTSVKRKVKRLLVPYFVWMTIHFILRKILVPEYAGTGVKEYVQEIFRSEFWFLRELFLFYMLIVICDICAKTVKHVKAGFLAGLLPASAIMYLIDRKLVLHAVQMLGFKYWMFFLMGYIIWNMLRLRAVKRILGKKCISVALLISCIAACFADVYCIATERKLPSITSSLMISLFMITYICFNCLGSKTERMPGCIAEISNVGRNTLGIYAFHWCVLFYSLWRAGVYRALLGDMPLPVRVTITYMAWILLCQVSLRVIKQSRLLKMILFGE